MSFKSFSAANNTPHKAADGAVPDGKAVPDAKPAPETKVPAAGAAPSGK